MNHEEGPGHKATLVSRDDPLRSLEGLDVVMVDRLASQGVMTVGDACARSVEDLRRVLKGTGEPGNAEWDSAWSVIRALEKAGHSIADGPVSDVWVDFVRVSLAYVDLPAVGLSRLHTDGLLFGSTGAQSVTEPKLEQAFRHAFGGPAVLLNYVSSGVNRVAGRIPPELAALRRPHPPSPGHAGAVESLLSRKTIHAVPGLGQFSAEQWPFYVSPQWLTVDRHGVVTVDFEQLGKRGVLNRRVGLGGFVEDVAIGVVDGQLRVDISPQLKYRFPAVSYENTPSTTVRVAQVTCGARSYDRMPKELMQRSVSELSPGESGWVIPWTVSRSENAVVVHSRAVVRHESDRGAWVFVTETGPDTCDVSPPADWFALNGGGSGTITARIAGTAVLERSSGVASQDFGSTLR